MKKNYTFQGIVALLFLSIMSAYAEQRIRICVSKIEGPDEFMNERFRLLFMEELSKIKNLEVVNLCEAAQLVVDGIGRVDNIRQSILQGAATTSIAGISGSSGEFPNALVSITVVDRRTGSVLFIGNKSSMGGGKGASHQAVADLVKDMKKRLKWK